MSYTEFYAIFDKHPWISAREEADINKTQDKITAPEHDAAVRKFVLRLIFIKTKS